MTRTRRGRPMASTSPSPATAPSRTPTPLMPEYLGRGRGQHRQGRDTDAGDHRTGRRPPASVVSGREVDRLLPRNSIPNFSNTAPSTLLWRPPTGGQVKVLTTGSGPERQRSRDSRQTASPSTSSWTTTARKTLAQVNLADSKISRPFDGRFMLDSYSVAKDGTLAASISTMDRPFELFTAPGGKLTRLTHVERCMARQVQAVPRRIRLLQVEGRHHRPWLRL